MKVILHTARSSKGRILVGDMTVLLLSLLIIISEIPILARNVPNIVFYGLVALFLVSAVNVILNLECYRRKTILWLVLYLDMIAVYKVLSISSAELAYYSTTVKFFFFLFAMLTVAGHMTNGQKYFILITVALSKLFTVFDNIRLYAQYGPSVYVHLFQWERFTTNSVNTTYVSSLLFLSGALFIVFLHEKRTWIKAGCVVLIALDILFIAIIAQRMIILVLAIVMLPLLVLYNQKRAAKRMAVFLLLLIAAVLVLLNLSAILDILDKAIGSQRLHLRFEQLKTLVLHRQTVEDGTLSARFSLFLTSIRTWFSSAGRLLFGAGDHRETNEIIGNHSNYIDECARYGIVGMLVWIPFTVSFMGSIAKCSGVGKSTPLMRQLKVILLIFVLNAILSDLYEATVGIQVFIVLPIILGFLREKNEAKDLFKWESGG